VVARREFLERVRTVWFVIVTLLGPIGMAAIIILPAWLSVESAKKEVRIQLVDRTGKDLTSYLDQAITASRANLIIEPVSADPCPPSGSEPDPCPALREQIRAEAIDGFLIIPEGAFEGQPAIYRGANATNQLFINKILEVVNLAVLRVRAKEEKIKDDVLNRLLAGIKIDVKQDTGTGEATSGLASLIVGYIVMFILYMAIILYAVNVLRSVVQEKTTRIVEILVSSVKPRALMLGKIIGVGGVGLFQLTIWAAIAMLLVRFRGQILGLFGVEGAGGFEIPSLTLGAIFLILAYFLLGYFFYSALYAAIGAMVNSEQEAQQAQTPVILLLIIPVACVRLVADDPRGGIAELLTMIPFSSPVLMPMRYLLGGASATDIAISLAILVGSIWVAVFLAARIYRVGILMYGKRPSLRELVRWIRYQ
jgi:ABC-2 type transport system permease protein